jgi:hypothetical protein
MKITDLMNCFNTINSRVCVTFTPTNQPFVTQATLPGTMNTSDEGVMNAFASFEEFVNERITSIPFLTQSVEDLLREEVERIAGVLGLSILSNEQKLIEIRQSANAIGNTIDTFLQELLRQTRLSPNGIISINLNS